MKQQIIIYFLILTLLGITSCRKETAAAAAEETGQSSEAADPETLEQISSVIWPPEVDSLSPDFELEENPLKKNYYIILDTSGSMAGQRIATAKEALTLFVNSVPAGANIGFMIFYSGSAKELFPLRDNKEALLDIIGDLDVAGTTPLRTSIEKAYEKIKTQGLRQLGYGDYDLVIITDGKASDGNPAQIVDLILAESPVTIHTIGFQIGKNHALNQPGKILYKTAENLAELTQGLEEVLAETEDFDIDTFGE